VQLVYTHHPTTTTQTPSDDTSPQMEINCNEEVCHVTLVEYDDPADVDVHAEVVRACDVLFVYGEAAVRLMMPMPRGRANESPYRGLTRLRELLTSRSRSSYTAITVVILRHPLSLMTPPPPSPPQNANGIGGDGVGLERIAIDKRDAAVCDALMSFIQMSWWQPRASPDGVVMQLPPSALEGLAELRARDNHHGLDQRGGVDDDYWGWRVNLAVRNDSVFAGTTVPHRTKRFIGAFRDVFVGDGDDGMMMGSATTATTYPLSVPIHTTITAAHAPPPPSSGADEVRTPLQHAILASDYRTLLLTDDGIHSGIALEAHLRCVLERERVDDAAMDEVSLPVVAGDPRTDLQHSIDGASHHRRELEARQNRRALLQRATTGALSANQPVSVAAAYGHLADVLSGITRTLFESDPTNQQTPWEGDSQTMTVRRWGVLARCLSAATLTDGGVYAGGVADIFALGSSVEHEVEFRAATHVTLLLTPSVSHRVSLWATETARGIATSPPTKGWQPLREAVTYAYSHIVQAYGVLHLTLASDINTAATKAVHRYTLHSVQQDRLVPWYTPTTDDERAWLEEHVTGPIGAFVDQLRRIRRLYDLLYTSIGADAIATISSVQPNTADGGTLRGVYIATGGMPLYMHGRRGKSGGHSTATPTVASIAQMYLRWVVEGVHTTFICVRWGMRNRRTATITEAPPKRIYANIQEYTELFVPVWRSLHGEDGSVADTGRFASLLIAAATTSSPTPTDVPPLMQLAADDDDDGDPAGGGAVQRTGIETRAPTDMALDSSSGSGAPGSDVPPNTNIDTFTIVDAEYVHLTLLHPPPPAASSSTTATTTMGFETCAPPDGVLLDTITVLNRLERDGSTGNGRTVLLLPVATTTQHALLHWPTINRVWAHHTHVPDLGLAGRDANERNVVAHWVGLLHSIGGAFRGKGDTMRRLIQAPDAASLRRLTEFEMYAQLVSPSSPPPHTDSGLLNIVLGLLNQTPPPALLAPGVAFGNAMPPPSGDELSHLFAMSVVWAFLGTPPMDNLDPARKHLDTVTMELRASVRVARYYTEAHAHHHIPRVQDVLQQLGTLQTTHCPFHITICPINTVTSFLPPSSSTGTGECTSTMHIHRVTRNHQHVWGEQVRALMDHLTTTTPVVTATVSPPPPSVSPIYTSDSKCGILWGAIRSTIGAHYANARGTGSNTRKKRRRTRPL
jgi:hypothetical protein